MLVVVLVLAAGLLVWKAFTPESVDAPLPASQFENPASAPATGPTGTDPVALDGGGSMSTAQMAPDTLFIPALGTYMPIEADKTVVASHYAGFETIKIPTDPTHGVRYAGGAPMFGGQTGTTLIVSHVSTRTAWGALRYLYRLQGGEMMYTKDAAGALQSWKLTQMRVEDHTKFPQEYWSPDGVRQLVVTTCGGTVGADHLFKQNIFAVAVPVDPAVPASQPALAG
ncbi:class F sortase [Cryobacterium zhongshanensis]|uniref:Class F sortase n=1 Tax=Cryobacterium zhongshanensis TaxID=2928153 RepID=A0AA41QX33_9MICO|nr:class F sortase [Cryobacterium zhongshanensis]MCI4659740.1 class F sortase [Cryobacterium zhongshanensis]